MVTARVVSQAALFGVILLLTRSLNPQEFGMFMTALAVQGYVYLIGSAGMPTVVVRELIHRPEHHMTIVSTYLTLALLLGLATCAMVSASVFFLPISSAERWLLILMALAAGIGAVNPECVFDAHHRQGTVAVLLAGSDLLFASGVLIAVVLQNLSLPTLGVLFLAKWLLFLASSLGMPLVRSAIRLRSVSLKEASHLWRSSWHLLVAAFLAMLPISGPTVVARVLHGPQEAAIVGLGVQILQVYLTFVMLAGRLLYPHVAGPYGFTRSFIIKETAFLLVLHAFLFSGSILGSVALVELVLPSSYRHALATFVLFSAAGLVAGIAGFLNYYLLVLKSEKSVTINYLIASVIFIGFIAIMAPVGCAVGISVATLAAFLALGGANALAIRQLVVGFNDRLKGAD